MKVMILGYEVMRYTKKDTCELKEGVSLYYASERDGIQGMATDNIWVDKNRKPALYEMLVGLDVSEPVPADFDYDFQIGSRFPTLRGIVLG